MQVQPYLNFDGRCEEALEFYKKALGAEVIMLMRFKDNPEPPPADKAPPDANKVMHASFRIGDSTIMASDCYCAGVAEFKGFSLSLTLANDADAAKRFNALADGGQVIQPISKTFFATSFGVVADRFGISWMIYVPAAAQGEAPAEKPGQSKSKQRAGASA
jgi:PhnB protein